MAFKASNVLPVEAYQTLKRRLLNLKVQLEQANTEMLAGSVDYEFIHVLYTGVKGAGEYLTTVKTTPGLPAYAKDQENDQNYDVVVEFSTLETTINTVQSWMEANIPLSVTLKPIDLWVTETRILDTFTTNQTAQLRTRVQAVIDLII